MSAPLHETAAQALWECSALRHGLFTPPEFVRICRNVLEPILQPIETELQQAQAAKSLCETALAALRKEKDTAVMLLCDIKDRVKADEDFSADEIIELLDKHLGKLSQGPSWIAQKVNEETIDGLRTELSKAEGLSRDWNLAYLHMTAKLAEEGEQLAAVTLERDEAKRDLVNWKADAAYWREQWNDQTRRYDEARAQLAACQSRHPLEALHECLAATGEEAGDIDDFRALVTREDVTVNAVKEMRDDRDQLQAQVGALRGALVKLIAAVRADDCWTNDTVLDEATAALAQSAPAAPDSAQSSAAKDGARDSRRPMCQCGVRSAGPSGLCNECFLGSGPSRMAATPPTP